MISDGMIIPLLHRNYKKRKLDFSAADSIIVLTTDKECIW